MSGENKKGPRHDITGQTFGSLRVDRMELMPPKGFQAVCTCLNCGNKDVLARPDALKSGHKSSCGCLAKFQKDDIVGQKFGHLEVTEMVQEFRPNIGENGKMGYYAICTCHNCGKTGYKTLKSSLKRGATTSCGCRRDHYEKNYGSNSVQFTGYKEIHGGKWTKLRTRAQRRGHSFELTIEDAWDLYEQQGRKCAMTNMPIHFKSRECECTASLDRIDCSLGYQIGNVQWVHKDVNIMRNVYSIGYFLDICCKVVETLGDKHAAQIC